ncbi:hypothetical protein OU994_18070 [Pseudoduganella sp. SL102]|uniref:hypothetical protein n=1 Tax=Pseudoduganella sp. SL102 TaxID=2995154 RepID=UPI00248AA59B|nr:hypothetical protein [Pseudoduganella sp. SL102]WBS00228.1 hypothetical protein OU994_18070 [Pseudoduganella sp. SL102]
MMRRAFLTLLLAASAAVAAPPQPDDTTMERARERFAVYREQGITGGELVMRMRSWFGYEFEALPDPRNPEVLDLFMIRRDNTGHVTYRAIVGSFK